MLILKGLYHVQPNKRLSIFPESKIKLKGTLESDLIALSQNCATTGRCDVQVMTQHGVMLGTLLEKKPLQFRLRQFEGHLSFPAKVDARVNSRLSPDHAD
ncbi:hypothetical protein [Deinococcus radiotolerans]|uniref:hypothetical protein n=1 Tax=Deinococcus radiotolerans TaxID=1309407 RepID=UPI00166EC41C|nr:hypothetical protein [Deinococcus radiotolerans]